MDYEKRVGVQDIFISNLTFFLQAMSFINMVFATLILFGSGVSMYTLKSLLFYGAMQVWGRCLKL